jgi:WD40 repeat protein
MSRVALAAVLAVAVVCPPTWSGPAPRLTLTPGDRQVVSVRYSPDGKSLAVLNGDEQPKLKSEYSLRLYDAVGGQLRAVVSLPPHVRWNGVTFSPDGKTIAAVGTDIHLYDVATGRETATLKPDRLVTAVAFHPSGKSLASVDVRKAVQLWDVAGRTSKTILPAADEYRPAAGFNPDGRLLVIWTARGLVLWDLDAGRERLRIDAQPLWGGNPGVFSPDGQTLAALVTSGSGRANVVALFSASTGAVLARLVGHTDYVEHAVFSPDGRTLATGGPDGVRIWDVATRNERAAVRSDGPNKVGVRALAFRPDGQTLVYEARFHAAVIDVATGAELAAKPLRKTTITPADQMETARTGEPTFGPPAISPDGATIAWPVSYRPTNDRFPGIPPAGARSVVEVWDMPATAAAPPVRGGGPEPRPLQQPARDKVKAAEWPPADFDKHPVEATLVRRIRRPIPIDGTGGRSRVVRLSSDGRLLARWDDDAVYVSEIDTGRERPKIDTHRGANRFFAFLADNTVLAIGQDQNIRLWDVAAGRDRAVIPKANSGACVLSGDGRTLATEATGVRIWDAASGRERAWIGKDQGPRSLMGTPLALSADGALLAWYRWNQPIRIWDVAAGREVSVLANAPGYVLSAALSPDGRTVATAIKDDLAVRLWDVATGREKARLVGDGSQPHAVFFSPDGQVLVSGNVLWDVATGAERARLSRYPPTKRFGDRGMVRFFPQAFTADGKAVFGNNPTPDGIEVSHGMMMFGGNALGDWPTGTLLSRIPDPSPGLLGPISPLGLGHMGTTFATGANGHFVALWFYNGTIEVWKLNPGPALPK